MFCVLDEVRIGNQNVPDILLLELSCCCADFIKSVLSRKGDFLSFEICFEGEKETNMMKTAPVVPAIESKMS